MSGPLALVIALSLAMAGCRPSPPKLEEAPCVAHSDCGLTTLSSDCCDACDMLPGTVTSVAARVRWCGEKFPDPASHRCPMEKCAPRPAGAFCLQERCQLRGQ